MAKKNFMGLVTLDIDGKKVGSEIEMKKLIAKATKKDIDKQVAQITKNSEVYQYIPEFQGFREKESLHSEMIRSAQQFIVAKKRNLLTRYHIVSALIYKLIARTPVDEKYYVATSTGKRKKYELEDFYYYVDDKGYKYKRKLTRYSDKKIWEMQNNATTKLHYPDTSVARDEWNVFIKVFNGVSYDEYTFSSYDFRKVDFDIGYFSDGSLEDGEWLKLEKIIRKRCNGNEITYYKIWNSNEHFRYLENGEYKKTNIKKEKFAKKGKKRYHGTNEAGFSVQAPRGIVSKTLAEMEQLEVMANANSDADYRGYTVRDIKKAKPSARRRKLKKDVYVATGKKVYGYITEEDYTNAILNDKPYLPVNWRDGSMPNHEFYDSMLEDGAWDRLANTKRMRKYRADVKANGKVKDREREQKIKKDVEDIERKAEKAIEEYAQGAIITSPQKNGMSGEVQGQTVNNTSVKMKQNWRELWVSVSRKVYRDVGAISGQVMIEGEVQSLVISNGNILLSDGIKKPIPLASKYTIEQIDKIFESFKLDEFFNDEEEIDKIKSIAEKLQKNGD